MKIVWAIVLNIIMLILLISVVGPLAINLLPSGSGFFVLPVLLVLQVQLNLFIFKKEINNLIKKIKE